MTTATWTLIIFAFMIISFMLNKIPMALTAMITMLLLVLTGGIEAKDALASFGSPTVITMVSMFIVAAGLNRTQMIKHISRLVYQVAQGSFTKVLAGYVLVTFVLGQFIPSIVALFALVSPLVVNMCEEMGVSPSKMMFSIGLVSVSCSFAFLPIGPYGAGFIEDNGILASYGLEQWQFGVWSQSLVKIPVAILVALWAIFIAPRFAPSGPSGLLSTLKVSSVQGKEPLSPLREIIGYSVFVSVILGLMVQPHLGIPSWVIAMLGAIVIVGAGVLTEKEAIVHMHMDIIMLYVGVAVLGMALGNTGAGEAIGDTVAKLLGNTTNSYVIGAVFFFASFILTSFLYNRGVSKILIPLAILTSISLGCDPRGPITLCYIGSMSSLITPMSTAVVPMMMGAGGYNSKDMLKLGLGPAILIGLTAVPLAMWMFPAFP